MIFGYEKSEILGQPVATLMSENSQIGHDDRRNEFFAAPSEELIQKSSREMVGQKKDGSLFPADVRLSFVQSSKGEVVIGSVRDITDRKMAEDMLSHTQSN